MCRVTVAARSSKEKNIIKYYQSSGQLHLDTGEILYGHSGVKTFSNNPDAQDLKDQGPIPRGKYEMNFRTSAYQNKGTYVIFLKPYPSNEMHGRTDFLIHTGGETASQGCIIIDSKADRKKIVARIRAGHDVLEVVR